MSDREFHPIANQFPMISEVELQELAEDIKKNGQIEDIILFEGKILDGRNRYTSCKMANVPPRSRVFNGSYEEAIDLVVSLNIDRRHLTTSQRAMIAASLADMKPGRPESKDPSDSTTEIETKDTPETQLDEGNSNKKPKKNKKKGTSIADAAKKLNISPKSVKTAKKITRKSPEKAEEVKAGKKTLSQAENEIDEEEGKITPESTAKKLGNDAVVILKRVPEEFKPAVYSKVKEWIESELK